MITQLITIIIRTHNSQHCLEDTLKTIAHQDDKQFQIVFLDRDSTDRTEELCKKNIPQCQFIKTNSHSNWLDAVKHAWADKPGLTLFINDNVRLPVNLVSTARRYFGKKDQLAILSPALYNEQLNIAHASYRDGINMVGTIVRGLSNREGKCFNINPSAFFIDLSRVQIIPLFSAFDHYFAYMLCWQSWIQGFEAHCLIDSVVRDFHPELLTNDKVAIEIQRLTLFAVMFEKRMQKKLKHLYWMGSMCSGSVRKKCNKWESEQQIYLTGLYEEVQQLRHQKDGVILNQMTRQLAGARDIKSKLINSYSQWWCRLHKIETLEDIFTCV